MECTCFLPAPLPAASSSSGGGDGGGGSVGGTDGGGGSVGDKRAHTRPGSSCWPSACVSGGGSVTLRRGRLMLRLIAWPTDAIAFDAFDGDLGGLAGASFSSKRCMSSAR